MDTFKRSRTWTGFQSWERAMGVVERLRADERMECPRIIRLLNDRNIRKELK